jgi:hypothetical protein
LRKLIRLLQVLAASFIASLLNPVGIRTWTTMLGYVNNRYLIAHTGDTLPPDFLQTKFWVLLFLLAFSLFILAVKREKLNAAGAFLIAGFSLMSLLSARNVHLYGIVIPFVLMEVLPDLSGLSVLKKLEELLSKVHTSPPRLSIWPLITFLAFAILLLKTPLGKINQFSPAFFPVEAVEWLQKNPQEGEMFNDFDWGGYLMLNLWPQKGVFIDSLTDAYGEVFTRKYEQVITLAPGWQNVLDEYHVHWAILDPNWPLVTALKTEGWQEVYRDGMAVILARTGE